MYVHMRINLDCSGNLPVACCRDPVPMGKIMKLGLTNPDVYSLLKVQIVLLQTTFHTNTIRL